MLILQQWAVLSIALLILLTVFGTIWILMRPAIMQRKREVRCTHDYQDYRREEGGQIVYQIFFCALCGSTKSRPMDIQIDIVDRPKSKLTKNEVEE